jgi:hypothetical protein
MHFQISMSFRAFIFGLYVLLFGPGRDYIQRLMAMEPGYDPPAEPANSIQGSEYDSSSISEAKRPSLADVSPPNLDR